MEGSGSGWGCQGGMQELGGEQSVDDSIGGHGDGTQGDSGTGMTPVHAPTARPGHPAAGGGLSGGRGVCDRASPAHPHGHLHRLAQQLPPQRVQGGIQLGAPPALPAWQRPRTGVTVSFPRRRLARRVQVGCPMLALLRDESVLGERGTGWGEACAPQHGQPLPAVWQPSGEHPALPFCCQVGSSPNTPSQNNPWTGRRTSSSGPGSWTER